MKRSASGLAIIEFMVAFALGSVVMVGVLQAMHSAAKLLQGARDLMLVNRKAALFFNQIERDVTGAVSYQKSVEYAPAKKKEAGKDEQKKPQEPQGNPKKSDKKEPYVPTFSLTHFDDASYKHRQKKWQTTKLCTFVTTSPLSVYDEVVEHWVRVGYELVPDKKEAKSEAPTYSLYRMQTPVLENHQFKNEDKDKKIPVARYLVLSGVQYFSLEVEYEKRPPEKKGGDSNAASAAEQEPVKTFVWQEDEEKKKSRYTLPNHISLHVQLWDDRKEHSYSFECILPFFVKDEAKALAKDEKKPEAKDAQKQQTPEIKNAKQEGAHEA